MTSGRARPRAWWPFVGQLLSGCARVGRGRSDDPPASARSGPGSVTRSSAPRAGIWGSALPDDAAAVPGAARERSGRSQGCRAVTAGRASDRGTGERGASTSGYSPLYACSPENQRLPEYVTSTIPNPTTSRSAAGRPAHRRWFRAWRYTA